MVEPNVIESDAEMYAKRYIETHCPDIAEKIGKNVADLLEIAFCDGFVGGADSIMRRVKTNFEEWTTHSRGGYRGQ